MQLDKSQLADMLQQQGMGDQAQQVMDRMPDQVDTDEHAGMLSDLGLDPQDIAKKAIGGGLGNIL